MQRNCFRRSEKGILRLDNRRLDLQKENNKVAGHLGTRLDRKYRDKVHHDQRTLVPDRKDVECNVPKMSQIYSNFELLYLSI